MPALSDYTSGTITLTNGSVNFTGAGTGWQAADFREGDTILGIEDNAGVEYVIATITGNGAGTLTQEWEGATGTYTYRMRYMADGARVTAQARNLIELLGNGNIQALAGLTGPGVPVFNGPHTMTIKPEADFGDVVGPSGAVEDRIAVFDGTTGKLIKDGGIAISGLEPARVKATNSDAEGVGTTVLGWAPQQIDRAIRYRRELRPGDIVTSAISTRADALSCNGAEVSRTTYADLFAAVGTYYGVGDGSTTFNIPDYRGLFLRGLDNGRGVDPGRALYSRQTNQFAAHTHGMPVFAGAGGAASFSAGGGAPTATYSTNSAGSGTETRPENASVNFWIIY